ncbi:unnamed protein product [Acanthoscelides obtectus]|uniref:Uncharacterized protein n=1 Tax=Acanthoscelides obtectus TaxID=200917 RepID=A0A9P0M849_ACAOB|nr:unnamed protein product [Acanthoscelides obtectus]CAK1621052.1 hypothetical protein AOBTE_LOCUS730 [Acanthoscelides obtectus]
MMAEIVDVRDVKTYNPRLPSLGRELKKLYRFDEANFLVENEETRGGALSCVHKIKISLRYLDEPGYQQGICQELGVSQATVSRTVDIVVNSIVAQSNE